MGVGLRVLASTRLSGGGGCDGDVKEMGSDLKDLTNQADRRLDGNPSSSRTDKEEFEADNDRVAENSELSPTPPNDSVPKKQHASRFQEAQL
jgi:hypothetical protein